MPGATTRLALPYPVPADSVDVPRDVKALADALDPISGGALAAFRSATGADGAAVTSGAWQTADIGTSGAATIQPAGAFTIGGDKSITLRDAGWYSMTAEVVRRTNTNACFATFGTAAAAEGLLARTSQGANASAWAAQMTLATLFYSAAGVKYFVTVMQPNAGGVFFVASLALTRLSKGAIT